MQKTDMNIRKNKIYMLISALSVLVLMPALLICQALFLGYGGFSFSVFGMQTEIKFYYILIFLILAFSGFLFFSAFERFKPSPRDIVVVVAFSVLAILGRAVFAFIPQVKPTIAIIIISAVCFGARTGFCTGALSMFVSNFFLMQGSWTPFQMIAAGIIGFLAGLIFEKLPKKTLFICIFGFLSIMLIYGGIMNPYFLLFTPENITLGSITAVYISGLPMDLLHGISTVVFLSLMAPILVKQTDRIKIKYGI